MEIIRAFRECLDHCCFYFSWEWMYLCSVTGALFSCSHQQSSQILCHYLKEWRYVLPKFARIGMFAHKFSVPYISILTSCSWGLLALMNLKVTAGEVFSYLISVGGSAAYIAWAGIIFTHLRVRSGLEKQGIPSSTFPFKAYGTIWIYRANLFFNLFILFIQGFTAFETPFNWRSFVVSYITIPTSVLLFLGYKVYHKTHW